MRPLLWSDLRALARALLMVPKGARAALCAQVLREADAADRYVQRMGRDHPTWGNGTLLAAAARLPMAAEPALSDPDYCACCLLVLQQYQADRLSRSCSAAR